MFADTLLDSSPAREPVLKRTHYAVALGVGALGFLVGLMALSPLFPSEAMKLRSAAAAAAGLVLMIHTLMVCYVYADARRLGFGKWRWFLAAIFFSLIGFLAYLGFSAAKTGDWRRAALPLGYIAQGVLITALVLVPHFHIDALPELMIWHNIPAPPAGVRVTAAARSVPVRQPARPIADPFLRAPFKIPQAIPHIVDVPGPQQAGSVLDNIGVPGGVNGGKSDGVLNSLVTANNAPPPTTSATRVTRIRRGGAVVAARLVFGPKPEYPPLARMARIEGAVHLEAVVSTDGTIEHLSVISGHPLLVPAAVAAVARWRYQPTRLNGEPVEVITDVVVNFVLGE